MSNEQATPWRWVRDVWYTLPLVAMFVLFVGTVLAGVAVGTVAPESSLVGSVHTGATSGVVLVGQALVGAVAMLFLQRFNLGRTALKLAVAAYLTVAPGLLLAVVLPVGVPVTLVPGFVIAVALLVHPEWYVVDAAALLFGATLIGTVGVSIGPSGALVALVLSAGFDAYAVYRSETMETLAKTGLDLNIPAAFYVPTERDASIRGGADNDGPLGTVGFRVLGVGDALFPGLLVVSATEFLELPTVVGPLSLAGLGALGGAVLGFVALEGVLQRFQGVHAGLPVLNAATILGYVTGALLAGLSLASTLGL